MTARLLPPLRTSALAFALRAGAALAPALVPALIPIAARAQDANAQLLEEVRQMRAEMGRLRQELDQLKRERAGGANAAAPAAGAAVTGTSPAAVTAAAPNATPGAVSGTAQTAAPSASPAAATSAAPAPAPMAARAEPEPRAPEQASPLSIFGYGELNYSRPRQDPTQAVATARRGVIGLGYRFDERTRLAMELEIEDAIASASDKGEVAFEQLYIEHDLTPRLSAKAGLFLLPMGYLNEVHEPTRYFGVTRNFVETAIIPSTWREIGVGLRGTTDEGLRWDAGVVTGFDLGKWDATSTEGRESPLGAIHQEGSQARARSLAGYAALNWNGWPGVNIGGSVYSGGAGHKQADFAGADASVTLMEAHARWSPGRWELTALTAAGKFRGIDALNATFAGQASPIPSRFGGSYVQAAYRAWDGHGYRLVPFGRYERFNTAAGGFPGLPVGLTPDPQSAIKVWTAGASLYLNPQVVLKVDYQKFVDQSALDRLNLGVGFHF